MHTETAQETTWLQEAIAEVDAIAPEGPAAVPVSPKKAAPRRMDSVLIGMIGVGAALIGFLLWSLYGMTAGFNDARVVLEKHNFNVQRVLAGGYTVPEVKYVLFASANTSCNVSKSQYDGVIVGTAVQCRWFLN